MNVAHDMPAWLDERHQALHTSAATYYTLRNQARAAGEHARAQSLEYEGDVFLYHVAALTSEWTV